MGLHILCVSLLAVLMVGCEAKTKHRSSCAQQLDAAWAELDLAKAEGFAGTVS